MSAKKKTLEQLFNDNATTDGNNTVVSSDFYYETLKLDKETVDAVNAGNQRFLAQSLEHGNQTLVNSIGEGDGSSIVFETGTDGFTFQHHINKDDGSDTGWDIFSAMENDLGDGSELESAYAACHSALADMSAEEEEDEGE